LDQLYSRHKTSQSKEEPLRYLYLLPPKMRFRPMSDLIAVVFLLLKLKDHEGGVKLLLSEIKEKLALSVFSHSHFLCVQISKLSRMGRCFVR